MGLIVSNITIDDVKNDFKDILRRTRNIKPKLRGTKRALQDMRIDAKKTLKQLEELEGSRTLQQRIEDAGNINLDANPPSPAEIAQLQTRQDILEELQDKKEQTSFMLDKIETEENEYKAQNTNKNLGKQVLVRGLMGAGHLLKTLGTAYFMATLNAGRPEAGAGAEATMNANNNHIFGSLSQLSTFNLGFDTMPMDMMGMMGGGMIPPPQMGGMPMPFHPLGMGGQEKSSDPMAAILQTIASSLNTPPIPFGGFEPQIPSSTQKNISLSVKIGNNTLRFSDEEAKNIFTNKYRKILESLGTEKLPTEQERHQAEQNLTSLFMNVAQSASDLTRLPSLKSFSNDAKRIIEDHITENLPETLKPFYDIGIKTDENYQHFIHNIDAPRVDAYTQALKTINNDNIHFPNIQYQSLKKAIEDNLNDDTKSAIIAHEINEKLGGLLKKQDYELLDDLFSSDKNSDVTSYSSQLQEYARKTQTDAIKNSQQDEIVPIKLEADSTDSNKKRISFTAKETSDWVTHLFPKQDLDNGFAFYGQDITQIMDTTGQKKYTGAFTFALADKDHATAPTLYSIKLDNNPPLPKGIYDYIEKFLNDDTGKSRDINKNITFSKENILKFKDICLRLPFSTQRDDGDFLAKKVIAMPPEGKDFSDFLKEKAKAEAREMNGFALR